MPNKYKRTVGARKYRDYTENQLNECLEAVKSKTLTQEAAARKYGISRRTINYKLKGCHLQNPGKPTVFSRDEEMGFVKCTLQMSDFGFPLTETDLRSVIKDYLMKIGRTVPNFKNNSPGESFICRFLERHPELSARFAANIKKARASVNEEVLTEYIAHLSKTLENVPAENIYNYDESNLTDDPGVKKCLVKRGSKYPVTIRNTSKCSISFMMAGNATGEVLPPFVVYKANRIWDTWCQGGPKGSRFTSTSSGWFDGFAFEEWFFSLMLPHLKKKEGVKVLIGDNLSSHISVNVIQACNDNNIRFVCLPPNSTHITQPLDVAFFRPLKSAWRKILGEYKESAMGRNKTSLDKQHFPVLLKKLMDAIEPNQALNLQSGFRKSGIHPVSLEQLLQAFHIRKSYDTETLEDSFKQFLERKIEVVLGPTSKPRKRKLNVAAGKSVSVEDVENNGSTEDSTAGPSNRTKGRKAKTSNQEQDYTRYTIDESDDDEVADDFSCHDSVSSAPEIFSDNEDDFNDASINASKENLWTPVKKEVGEYVIFTYEGELFPGIIIEIKKEGAVIRAMIQVKNAWKWPVGKQDELFYEWSDVISHINEPTKISRTREIFCIPELSPQK